jgi:hypothetical protein
MGAVLMLVLTIAVLAVAVIESRDRVRRDILTDDASLRLWYDAHYARRGMEFSRENLELALQRAQNLRRWGPFALSGGTLLVVVILTSMAASRVPGIESVWHSPQRLADVISGEVLVEAAVALALVPVLVVEGILAALYVAELDISRLQRLLDSLG